MAENFLFKKGFPLGWNADGDAFNAADGSLLRMDNLCHDEDGVLVLRPASIILDAPISATNRHALYDAIFAGTKTRYSAVASYDAPELMVNGVSMGVTFAGPLTYGTILGRVLMAGGTVKKKHRGSFTTEVEPWGLPGPVEVPLVSALNVLTKTLASFDTAESPAFTASEGTIGAFQTGEDDVASGALELTPNATTGRGTITKVWASDQDYSSIGGAAEDPADIFDFCVRFTEPEKVIRVHIMVGLSTDTTDPFKTDYYIFTWNIGGVRQSIVDISSNAAVADRLRREGANDGTDPNRPPVNEAARKAKKRAAEAAEPPNKDDKDDVIDGMPDPDDGRSRERPDRASSPGWTHLACLRTMFNRIGSTTGRDWKTVRGFKVVYEAFGGATGTVRFDNAVLKGGTQDRAFTGVFQVRYRQVHDDDDIDFREISLASPPSLPIRLVAQGIQVVIPETAMRTIDPNTTNLDLEVKGGVLTEWYRFNTVGVIPLDNSWGLDEFLPLHTSGSPTMNELSKLNAVGIGLPQAVPFRGQALTLQLFGSEADALREDTRIPDDYILPPDDIIAIAGPYQFRTFVLTETKLYISPRMNPSVFRDNLTQVVGDATEKALWLALTSGGIFIGTTRDILWLQGTGADQADGTVDFRLDRLSIGYPPVDSMVAVEGNFIVYHAADGLRTFNGTESIPVSRVGVEQLFKGHDRYEVTRVLSIPQIAFPWRAAFYNNCLYLLHNPANFIGSPTDQCLMRYDGPTKRWYYLKFNHESYKMMDIRAESDGTLVMSTASGQLIEIDPEYDEKIAPGDDGRPIRIEAWTPFADGGDPLSKKDAYEIVSEIDSAGGDLKCDIHLDGSEDPTKTVTLMDGRNIVPIIGLPSWTQMQLRLRGKFDRFALRNLGVSYRARPQTHRSADSGIFAMSSGGEAIRWPTRVIVNVGVHQKKDEPASKLRVRIMCDNELVREAEFDPEFGVTKPYVARVPRGASGHTMQVVVRSSHEFDWYWLEVHYRPTGNLTEKTRIRIGPTEP